MERLLPGISSFLISTLPVHSPAFFPKPLPIFCLCWLWLAHGSCPRREAGDVWCLPPVWNIRAVSWFHFASASLVLLPSPVTLSVLSFSACWPFLLNFSQKILQYFSLRDRLFCMAPVSQLGEDSWSVVCAACCHMTLVFVVMHLYNILEFFIAFVHSFF